MDETLEGQEPHKTPEGSEPQNTPSDTVTLTKAELEELKHKAEVSSQNFERAKKAENRILELENQPIINNPPEDDIFSEEGKVLKGELSSLKSELSEVKGELVKKDLLITYPALKDMWMELEEFRQDPENKGMNLRTAARAFLIEKGLLETQRKGLEKPTGGPRVPLSTGMTAEDVKHLRETNWKKYQELLLKGLIKIES